MNTKQRLKELEVTQEQLWREIEKLKNEIAAEGATAIIAVLPLLKYDIENGQIVLDYRHEEKTFWQAMNQHPEAEQGWNHFSLSLTAEIQLRVDDGDVRLQTSAIEHIYDADKEMKKLIQALKSWGVPASSIGFERLNREVAGAKKSLLRREEELASLQKLFDECYS